MANPYYSAVIWRNTRKIGAAIIGVRTSFSCNGNAIDLGVGPGSRFHSICKHIHEHIGGGLLKHLTRCANFIRIQDHPALAIYNACK